MAVKIRLKRMGKIRTPFYRVVVADSRTKRDGRVIEEIGTYNPKADPSIIHIESERAQYWLGVGAQPSDAVAALLKLTGDWQLFNGESAPSPLLVAEPKRDKGDIFNDALKDAHGDIGADATTTPTRTAKKSAAKKATAKKSAPAEPPADEAPAETPTADTPTPDAPAAEAPTADPPSTQAAADAPASDGPSPDTSEEA